MKINGGRASGCRSVLECVGPLHFAYAGVKRRVPSGAPLLTHSPVLGLLLPGQDRGFAAPVRHGNPQAILPRRFHSEKPRLFARQFERQAALTPQRIAVTHEAQSLDYAGLNRRAFGAAGQHAAARHAHRPHCHEDGQHHRKLLRQHRHAKRNARQHGIHRRAGKDIAADRRLSQPVRVLWGEHGAAAVLDTRDLSGVVAYEPTELVITALAAWMRVALAPAESGGRFITLSLAAAVCALYGGFRIGMLSTVAGMLLINFLLVKPYFSFAIENPVERAEILEGFGLGEGALFRIADLKQARGSRPAELDRVIVAVDPPASAHGDACGIVVVGRRERRAFVLADGMMVEGATLEHGLLHVDLSRPRPERPGPRGSDWAPRRPEN